MSLPEVLFDGHRVLQEVRADYPTFRVNDVAIVLDAVVKLAREDGDDKPDPLPTLRAAVVRCLAAERALQVAMLDPAWRAKYPTLAGIESPEVVEKTAARVALRLLTEQ